MSDPVPVVAQPPSETAKTKETPPMIVTKQSSSPVDREDTARSAKQQARTPKHANTTEDGRSKDGAVASYPPPQDSFRQPCYNSGGGGGYPPRDHRYSTYDHRGPQQQLYSPRQQQQPPPPFYHTRSRGGSEMATVSPGTNDYRQQYGGFPPHGGGPDHRYSNSYDQQRGYGNGGDQRGYNGDPQQPQQYNYPPGYRPQYRGQQQYPPHGGYNQQYGRAAPYPPPPRDYGNASAQTGFPDQTNNNNGNFTRAVSSSFDRSVKSRGNEPLEPKKMAEPALPPASAGDNNSVAPSDDSSWRQLNQVASIDEAELQKRIATSKSADESKGRNIRVNEQPTSTSSSLTNSPSNEHATSLKQQQQQVVDKPPSTTARLTGLDSLSSVASGQEPMDTDAAAKSKGPPSPTSSAGSLDLMKCHSGSSGLLHGFTAATQGGLSSTSLDLVSKRSREERSDVNTGTGKDTELRRAPSAMSTEDLNKEPAAKKARKDGKSTKDPLGIDCSPPLSPSGERKRAAAAAQRQPRANFNASPGPNLYFDKAPSYTYSIDSNPSFPARVAAYPPPQQPGRPASSSSSTITPMERGGDQQDGVGPSLPSWDIQPQDSFGNGSTGGGGPLMSNFSFSQDYPMLQSSGSNLGGGSNLGYNSNNAPPDNRRPINHGPPPSAAESRNQSFDGGHYHGDFARSGSMDQSYGPPRQQQPGGPYHQADYNMKGNFPPQAPSWGTTTSTTGSHHGAYNRGPPPPPYGNYRPPHSPHYNNMERNYSQDSAVRTSPPPPRMAQGGPRNNFAPPPEFAAPHNPHLSRRPPPAVYIMSSSGREAEQGVVNKNRPGIYSWTKEDDARLTEVMKKYKNPRDWAPIAKEHGRAKNAKECHERWIRYLKPGVRKGQWQDHEDAIVVEAVTTSTEQPFTRWSDLAQRLPGRVGKQIRDRWVNHLNPSINHLPFSREDDLLLWDGHKKLGKRWVEISTKYFNSSRSENHIKNRWYSASFKKFISNEFGPDAYSGGKDKKSKGKKSTEIKSEATVEAAV